MRAFLWILAGLGLLAGLRIVTRPRLRHFQPSEFGAFWLLMSADLLLKLDEFRERYGAPVRISPAAGALGREDDEASKSQHNVLRWGEVRAADIMPAGFNDPFRRQEALRIATEIGFTGIGLYPDWQPQAGMHLDVRVDRQPGNPATWAGIKTADGQEFVGIERGLV